MITSFTMSSNWTPSPSNQDVLIMATAAEALRAKQSAVQRGYFKDDFIAAFSGSSSHPVQVIIRRGTFARVACIEKAMREFLLSSSSTTSSAQVVVLGSGNDTSFFRFLAADLLNERNIRWFEVDHEQVILGKASTIERSNTLFKATIEKRRNIYAVTSKGQSWPATYHLIAHDLKNDHEDLIQYLQTAGLDPELPTLVVLECVQMYLPKVSTSSLLKTLTNSFVDCHVAMYEPILCSDAFGKMMQENLEKSGVVHPESGLVRTRTVTEYQTDLLQNGFLAATGCDMYTAFDSILTPAQRDAANRCDFLDELEEWMLIMQHYCFVVASNNLISIVGQQFTGTGPSSTVGFVDGQCEQMLR